PPTWASGRGIRRWGIRTRRVPSSVSPTTTWRPSCSASGIPPIAHYARSANRIGGLSTRSSIADVGDAVVFHPLGHRYQTGVISGSDLVVVDEQMPWAAEYLADPVRRRVVNKPRVVHATKERLERG